MSSRLALTKTQYESIKKQMTSYRALYIQKTALDHDVPESVTADIDESYSYRDYRRMVVARVQPRKSVFRYITTPLKRVRGGK